MRTTLAPITTTDTYELAMKNPVVGDILDETASSILQDAIDNRFSINSYKTLGLAGLIIGGACFGVGVPGVALALGTALVSYGSAALWEKKATGQTNALPFIEGLTLEQLATPMVDRNRDVSPPRSLTSRDYLTPEDKAMLMLCSHLRPLALRYLDIAENDAMGKRFLSGLVSQIVKWTRPEFLNDPDVRLAFWSDPHFGRGVDAYMRYIEDRFQRTFASDLGIKVPDDIPEVYESTEVDTELIEVSPTLIASSSDVATPLKRDASSVLGNVLKNMVVVGLPGSGKGFTVAHAAIVALQRDPSLKLFFVDPKGNPDERYLNGVIPDSRIFDKPIPKVSKGGEAEDEWLESLWEFLETFENEENAILIFDECSNLQKRYKGQRWDRLTTFLHDAATMGRAYKRYIWSLTQSPNLADLGLSGGSLQVYRRVAFALTDTSNPDHDASLLNSSTTFFGGDNPQKVLGPRMMYDSLSGGWMETGELPSLKTVASIEVEDKPLIEVTEEPSNELHRLLMEKFNSRPNERFDPRTIQATSSVLKKRYKLAVIGEALEALVNQGKVVKQGQKYRLSKKA